MVSKELKFEKYIEDPNSIPVLKEFYKEKKNYAFATQIAWVSERYRLLKLAANKEKAIIDGSLLSDSVVCNVLKRRGELTEIEHNIYLNNVNAMISDHSMSPHGAFPDLFIYLDITPENELANIHKRDRDMEVGDPNLDEYIKDINKGFKDWYRGFTQAPVLKIDMNDTDFVNKQNDKEKVLNLIKNKLEKIGVTY